MKIVWHDSLFANRSETKLRLSVRMPPPFERPRLKRRKCLSWEACLVAKILKNNPPKTIAEEGLLCFICFYKISQFNLTNLESQIRRKFSVLQKDSTGSMVKVGDAHFLHGRAHLAVRLRLQCNCFVIVIVQEMH